MIEHVKDLRVVVIKKQQQLKLWLIIKLVNINNIES